MALIKGFPHDGIVTINRVILKKGRTLDELQERVALMCENVKTHIGKSAFLGPRRAVGASLGAILGPSWGHLGDILAPSWAILEPSWGHLGPILAHLLPS